MLVFRLVDWRSRYGSHINLLLGSHWVTGTLGEGETMMTTRTRNAGLTQLPYVVLMSFQRSGGCLWVAEKPFAMPNKEIGYLWDRGNPHLILYFLSIMATTIWKPNYAPGLNLISNASKTNLNTWADCMEEFSSNLNDNNAFSNDGGPQFFIIKRNENDFTKLSSFLIKKELNLLLESQKVSKNCDLENYL